MTEGARYQAVKPHHQRVEDKAFHLSADESRWIGFSEDDVSKEAEHFRNARMGDSRVDRESPEEMRAKRRPYGRGGGVGRGLGVGVVLGAAGNWNLPTRVNQLTVAVPR
jgi:hypothetical protein